MTVNKPRRFAEGTSVDVTSSHEQIKRLVSQHGATGFLLAEAMRGDEFVGVVQFQIFGRMLRYERMYPKRGEVPRNTHDPKRWQEGEWRRRWRALNLIIKAKLELVNSGDTSFEHEFLGDIMLPDGSTVGSQALPAIKHAYETGVMPKLLSGRELYRPIDRSKGHRGQRPLEGQEVQVLAADGSYKRERVGETVHWDARRGVLLARIAGADQHGPVLVTRIGERL